MGEGVFEIVEALAKLLVSGSISVSLVTTRPQHGRIYGR